MKIHNLTLKGAKDILEKLDNEFGLVWTHGRMTVHGRTITATIERGGDRYMVDIQSTMPNFRILDAIPEYDDEYFLKNKY